MLKCKFRNFIKNFISDGGGLVYNTKEIAMELGISADLIYRWRRELEQHPDLAFSGNGIKQLTQDQKELEHLRKQLKDVTMERDILKKAVSIFSKSDRKY